jgi:hypothetical protein
MTLLANRLEPGCLTFTAARLGHHAVMHASAPAAGWNPGLLRRPPMTNERDTNYVQSEDGECPLQALSVADPWRRRDIVS